MEFLTLSNIYVKSTANVCNSPMLENHLKLKARLRWFVEWVTNHRIGWHYPGPSSVPLLTFDDGPLPNTWSILEILDQLALKATFFMVAQNMLQYPDIVKAAASAGHCVASHGYQHVIMKRLSLEEFQRQVCASYSVTRRLAGHQPRLFRPPKGQINPLQAAWLLSQGIRLVFWSHQWDARSHTIIEPVSSLGSATPIILFHDYDDIHDIKSVLKIFC